MAKIIVIEGTDCSGKETQTQILVKELEKMGKKVWYTSYPNYHAPTGKIIAGPYLGKEQEKESWFPENASQVNPKVASLYFAADRYYDLPNILQHQKDDDYIIFNRYTYSNMAHQGGKIKDKKERQDFYRWMEELEFGLLNLPVPDIRIFLHMPLTAETLLRKSRVHEKLDEHEKDEKHLQNAEKAYIEIAKLYHFYQIECTTKSNLKRKETIKNKEQIAKEIWDILQNEEGLKKLSNQKF